MSRAPRVLVVSYYFPPVGGGGVSRTLGVLRGLSEAGFEPWVLTVDDAAWPRDESRLAEVPARTRVLRLPNPDWGRVRRFTDARRGSAGRAVRPGHSPGRLRRWLVPDLHVGWSALATPVAAALALTRSVDLVYSSCPPYSAHAPAWLARRLGVPWIADFRDGWTCCPTRADLPPRRVAFERRLEARVLRDADRVLFTSEAVRARCVERTPGLAARSETLLTGYDRSSFVFSPGIAPPRDRLQIVHAGSVCGARRDATLEQLLRALRRFEAETPRVRDTVRVRFLGAEPVVAEAIAAAGLDGWVRVEPGVPRAKLGDALAAAHLCLALSPPGPRGGEPIPGKLFDAAAAGRPLLALTSPGPLADLIAGRGLGVARPAEETSSLAALLGEIRARVLRGEPALPFRPEGGRSLDGRESVARVVELCRGLLPAPESPWSA